MREVEPGPPRALLSYWYFRKQNLDKLDALVPGIDLMSDSGGFSAFTQGHDITVAEYAAWLKKWDGRFTAIANLDAIRDPKATWRNQQALEDALGAPVLPVVHFGTPDYEKWLAFYFERGYRYLCLGGMVKRNLKAVLRWTTRCHRIARDAGAVLHGFGVTAATIVRDLPWYSCDSSAWGQAHRFGQTMVFDPRTCTMVRSISGNATRKDFVAKQGRGIVDNDMGVIIRQRGFDSRVLTHPEHWDRDSAACITADSFQRLETYLRIRHGTITRPGTSETGVRLYLVDAWLDQLELLRGRVALEERKARAAAAPEAS